MYLWSTAKGTYVTLKIFKGQCFAALKSGDLQEFDFLTL